MSDGLQPPEPRGRTFERDANSGVALRAAAHAARERSRELVSRALVRQALNESLLGRSRELVQQSADTQSELRRTLVEYVTTLRQLGEPPESVIVLVKSMVEESASYGEDAAHIDPLRRRALRDKLVRWAIDGYYAA
jgi:phenylpyruvate tautomerase PptA (4-oxalocrotonate tautomerase family)